MKNTNFQRWSDAELATLKELAGKYPASYIGAQIGRGTEGARKMIRKLGLTPYKVPITKPVSHLRPNRKSPVQNITPIAKPEKKKFVTKEVSMLEKCPVHHCWVSITDWAGHVERLGGTCKRPAA